MKIVKINDFEILQLSDANYYKGDSIEYRLITLKWIDNKKSRNQYGWEMKPKFVHDQTLADAFVNYLFSSLLNQIWIPELIKSEYSYKNEKWIGIEFLS